MVTIEVVKGRLFFVQRQTKTGLRPKTEKDVTRPFVVVQSPHCTSLGSKQQLKQD